MNFFSLKVLEACAGAEVPSTTSNLVGEIATWRRLEMEAGAWRGVPVSSGDFPIFKLFFSVCWC